MARVVRKVSNKAVQGQKKQGKFYTKKWFWIVASIILIAAIAVGIVLAVVLNKDEDDSTNTIDYFGTCETVDFVKASHKGIANYLNEEYTNPQNGESLFVENVFVFAYSITDFHPSKEDDSENYSQTHADILDFLIHLQENIDAYNESEGSIKAQLYIIDTTHSNNEDIFTDYVYGGDSSSEGSKFLFAYLNNGELENDPITIRGNEYTLNHIDTGSKRMYVLRTIIGQAANFVQDGCVLED